VANDTTPLWSPDGKQLLFASDRGDGVTLPAFLKSSIDLGASEVPIRNATPAPVIDWSRNGLWMLSGNGRDIWVRRADDDSKPFPYLATDFAENNGRFSPDGDWIVYVSNETGRAEVYVRPFAGRTAAAEGRIQISTEGGDFPRWGADNRHLFYMSLDSTITAVDLPPSSRAGGAVARSRLFQACPETGSPARGVGFPFDTRDGQRFLVSCRVQPAGRYVVLLNWSAGPP
jgi:Tol biopolymer transport system component